MSDPAAIVGALEKARGPPLHRALLDASVSVSGSGSGSGSGARIFVYRPTVLAAAMALRFSVVAAKISVGLGLAAFLLALVVHRRAPTKSPLGRIGVLLMFLGFLLYVLLAPR